MRLVWPRYVFQFDLSTSPPLLDAFVYWLHSHPPTAINPYNHSRRSALNVSLSWPAIVFSVPTSIQSDKDDRRSNLVWTIPRIQR